MRQGEIPSCAGNALVGVAGTGLVYDSIPLDNPRRPTQDVSFCEELSREIYTDARTADGRNSEGTFLLTAARIGKRYGLLGGYRFINSLGDVLSALQHHAVVLGGPWYSSFDEPASDGLVAVEKNARPRMGHAYTVDELDVERRRVGCTNSWGTGWGLAGRFYLSWDALRFLLICGGEATAIVPVHAGAALHAPVGVK
jgi:hypothetical protein